MTFGMSAGTIRSMSVNHCALVWATESQPSVVAPGVTVADAWRPAMKLPPSLLSSNSVMVTVVAAAG